MTEKRFTHKKWYNERQLFDGDEPFAIVDVYNQAVTICNKLNELAEENNKIKSILLKKVEELNDAYNKSAKAGMPTGGIIGELDSFEQICKIMEWLE